VLHEVGGEDPVDRLGGLSAQIVQNVGLHDLQTPVAHDLATLRIQVHPEALNSLLAEKVQEVTGAARQIHHHVTLSKELHVTPLNGTLALQGDVEIVQELKI
jgi:hypothetical protein